MDYKGDRVLEDLFRALDDSYFSTDRPQSRILPEKAAALMKAAGKDYRRKRLVARDFLANLTDGQALRIHKRLYDPEYASIIDLD
jgi:dGTP triphosphohydrolase